MANYTMTFREFLDRFCKDGDGNIDPAVLFPEMTLSVPEHLPDLQGRVVAHFYLREIGQETPDAFRYYFRATCLELLPKYNVMLKAMSKDFYANVNVNGKTTVKHDSEQDSTSHGEGTSNTTNDNTVQDTPYTMYPEGSEFSSSKANGTSTGKTGSDSTGHTEAHDTTETTVQSSSEIENARRLADLFIDADRYFVDGLDTCFMQIF